MKISNDPRIDKEIRSLPREDSARIVKVVDLFANFGFGLTGEYLKKVTTNLWELRAGRYRLLLGLIGDEALIVNMFFKKTQKTPKKEIKLAQKRLKSYQ